MTTLDRYIARSLVINVLVLLLLLFSFVVMVDVALNVHRYIAQAGDSIKAQSGAEKVDAVRQGLVSALYVADLWWPRLLQLYNYVIALVVCGAVGFTFVQMVRHREVVAALAGGVSLYRLSRPVFAVAAVFVGLQVMNQEFVLPRIAPLLARGNFDAGKRELDAFAIRLMADGQRRVFLAEWFDPATGTMHGLDVWERDESGLATRRISAESAVWQGGSWRLTNGQARKLGIGPGSATDPRQVPPTPLAELKTDLDPTTILADRYRSFSQSLSWSQVSRVLSTPNLRPEVRDQMLRVGWGRVSLIVCTFLTLAMMLPFFLLREPRNMILQSLKAAPVAIGGIVGAVLGTAAAVPGVPAELGVFVPVLVLLPLSVGLYTSIKT